MYVPVGITLQFLNRDLRFLSAIPFLFQAIYDSVHHRDGMMHIVFIWSGDIYNGFLGCCISFLRTGNDFFK
jgi:hypothetical protein